MVFPGVPERIHAVAPEMKFVFIARHPVDRAVSQYQHSFLSGLDVPEMPYLYGSHEWKHLVDTSSYAQQIRKYFEYFSPDQFLFIDFDKFCRDPKDTWNKVSEFLDVSTDWQDRDTEKQNSGSELAALPSWALSFSRTDAWTSLKRIIPGSVRAQCKTRLGSKRVQRISEFTQQMKQDFWGEVSQDVKEFAEISGITFEAPIAKPAFANPRADTHNSLATLTICQEPS
jgi:hypothetical protein